MTRQSSLVPENASILTAHDHLHLMHFTLNNRLEIQKNAFSRVTVKVWNDIPVSVRNLNKKMFKQKLHLTLMNILKESNS